MIHTISSVTDIATYVANYIETYDEAAAAELVEALRAADHPPWGTEWTEFFETVGVELATEINERRHEA